MDRDNNTTQPATNPEIKLLLDSPAEPVIQALLDRITALETKLTARASAPRTTEPRAICKREHDASNWKVTPKGVRYCVLCYRELRLEQAEKKLRELGRIS